ncbi:MAG TPA: hypothetical protein VGP13_01365 [Candidatus Paceibacterota bacterium]|jgi:hypothetical protein|nr:hypothetical protein [Candidatus Paceibacterota bacterium]
MRKILNFFDKLEDKVRIRLSHYPILYALIGAVGIVLIWKGVWETAEYFPILFGLPSVVLGLVILLATGLLVSFFIGDNIIISGFKHEKKLVEKSEKELLEAGKTSTELLAAEIQHIHNDLEEIKKEIKQDEQKV